jgi:hypothetical protein
MLAGAVLLAVLAGGAPRLAVGDEAKGPVKLTEKRYTDDAGRTLVLSFGGAEKERSVKAQATDSKGKPIEVRELPVKDLTVCLPKAATSTTGKADAAKPSCQPLAGVTEGAFLKMGTATCTCYVYSGILYCFGDTCY